MKRYSVLTAAAAAVMVLASGILSGCSREATAETVLKSMDKAMAKQAASDLEWAFREEREAGGEAPDSAEEITAEGRTVRNRKESLSRTEASVRLRTGGQEQILSWEIYAEPEEDGSSAITMKREQDGEAVWIRTDLRREESGNGKEEKKAEDGLTALLISSCTLMENPVELEGNTCWQINGELDAGQLLDQLKNVPEIRSLSDAILEDYLEAVREDRLRLTLLVRKADSLPADLKLSRIPEEDAQAAETGSAGESQSGLAVSLAEFTTKMTFPAEAEEIVLPEAAEDAVHLEAAGDISGLAAAKAQEDAAEDPVPGPEGSVYGKLADPVTVREYAETEEEALLWEDEEAEIRLVRVYTGKTAVYADILLKNRSDRELEFSTRYAAVNRIMSDGNFVLTVEAGGTKTACLYMPGLERTGMPAVLGLMLSATDIPSYEDVIDTGLKEIVLADPVPEAVLPGGGSVLLDDDSLQVTAWPADDSSGTMTEIPFVIVNRTDRTAIIDSRDVTASGKSAEGFLHGEILPGHTLFTALSFTRDDLRRAGLTETGEVTLRLEISDPVSYEVIRVTEPLTLP